MKNELNLTYLVPRTLYHNFRKFLSSSQLQELDRANMTYLQEPQASTILPGDNTVDTFLDTTIPPSPLPTAPKPPAEPPKLPAEPPKLPVEPPRPPVEPPKPTVEPPHASDLSVEPERRGSWYICAVCGHKSHGMKKHNEHMLTHSSTPAKSVEPAKTNRSSPHTKTPKRVRVEPAEKQEEEQQGFGLYKFMKFT